MSSTLVRFSFSRMVCGGFFLSSSPVAEAEFLFSQTTRAKLTSFLHSCCSFPRSPGTVGSSGEGEGGYASASSSSSSIYLLFATCELIRRSPFRKTAKHEFAASPPALSRLSEHVVH
jgi:hypothetical protein